jgi:hypothetical protein
VTPVVCRLHQLDEYTAGVLRVHEVDARAGCAAPRLVVEQAQALLAQSGAGRVDVRRPNVSPDQAIAPSRSATAMPT